MDDSQQLTRSGSQFSGHLTSHDCSTTCTTTSARSSVQSSTLRPTSSASLPNFRSLPTPNSEYRHSTASIQSAPLPHIAQTIYHSGHPGNHLAVAPHQPQDAPSPAAKKPNKATNKYRCSHCQETFRKSTDQRKHFKEACKSLGPGYKACRCTTCGDVTPTETQAKKHQRDLHNNRDSKSGFEKVDLKGRICYSCCCPGGEVFYDMEEFHNHARAKASTCNLVVADQRFRLCTLLEQGKYAVPGGHDYLFAEVAAVCTSRGIPVDDWKKVILSTNLDSCDIANKLEWGHTDSPLLLESGLGFQTCRQVVEEVFAQIDWAQVEEERAAAPSRLCDDSRSSGQIFVERALHSVTPQLDPATPDDFASTSAVPGVNFMISDDDNVDDLIYGGFQPYEATDLKAAAARPQRPVIAPALSGDVLWKETPLRHDTKTHEFMMGIIPNALYGRGHPALTTSILSNVMPTTNNLSGRDNTVSTLGEQHENPRAPTHARRDETAPIPSRKRPLSLYSQSHPDGTARGSWRSQTCTNGNEDGAWMTQTIEEMMTSLNGSNDAADTEPELNAEGHDMAGQHLSLSQKRQAGLWDFDVDDLMANDFTA